MPEPEPLSSAAIVPSALEVPPPAEFSISAPGPLPRVTHRSLSVMLSGGGALGPQELAVGMGALAVEWGFFEPWAVSIDAGFESQRSRTLSEGTVRVSLQWATLSARRSFFAEGMDGLHVSLGARLIRFEASGEGFTTRTSASLLTAGAGLNVEWRQTLTGGLFLLGRFTAQARLRPESFTVAGIGAVLTVPPWGFGLQAGLGWNFL